jgi:hypothetical protein
MNPMPPISEEGRYADRRDDYRNGFVDAVAHMRGEFPPTEQQIFSALEELQNFRRNSAALLHATGSHRASQGSRIDALQRR